jgi:hypothetical protein
VVREERRLVISKLHQKPTTKMPMLLNPTHYEINSTQIQIHPYSLTPQMISKSLSSSRALWGMCSLGKRARSLVRRNRLRPSEEKPSEQPQPKPKPKLVRFHCDYCGRNGHKGEFCFKKKCEERMAKEWANKDKHRPSNGVLEPRVQMPRAKVIVKTVPARGD